MVDTSGEIAFRRVGGGAGLGLELAEVVRGVGAHVELPGDRRRELGQAANALKQDIQTTFDEALLRLYRDGRITMEEALANADSRSNLEAKINFG